MSGYISARLGIDLDLVDVRDPDAVRWLRACVWRDQIERRERLDIALDLVAHDPPKVVRADATTDLPDVAGRLPRDDRLVVFHSNVAAYLDAEGRRRLRQAVETLASDREVAWAFLEGRSVVADLLPGIELPDASARMPGLLGLVTWEDGTAVPRILARVAPHGTSMEWLGA